VQAHDAAGMPIRWRITGSRRDTNTPITPNFADHASAASIFAA